MWPFSLWREHVTNIKFGGGPRSALREPLNRFLRLSKPLSLKVGQVEQLVLCYSLEYFLCCDNSPEQIIPLKLKRKYWESQPNESPFTLGVDYELLNLVSQNFVGWKKGRHEEVWMVTISSDSSTRLDKLAVWKLIGRNFWMKSCCGHWELTRNCAYFIDPCASNAVNTSWLRLLSRVHIASVSLIRYLFQLATRLQARYNQG
jgi:hypothetical protein